MMASEVWKPVIGYEGVYEVSNCGSIRRVGGNVMKQHKTQSGYLSLSLCKNGKVKTFQAHRLVAMAFVPNPNSKPFVNHLDEDKTNNRADNLEWVTSAENNRYGTAPQRTAETLREYYKTHPYAVAKSVRCVETGIVYPTITEAARAVGINFRNISACLRGESCRPTAGGYHWELV